jgi:CheY-like chemotaxis protein
MQSCKVLLVDDEPLVIDAIKRALHKESYEVVSAAVRRKRSIFCQNRVLMS